MSSLQELPLDLRKAQINSILGREEDELFKSEGSRGGKVIGHTKSGKPIYKHYFHGVHDYEDATKPYERLIEKEHYTSADHQDAMERHLQAFDRKKANYEKTGRNRADAQNHFDVAQYHFRQKGVKTNRYDIKNKTSLDAI